MHIFSAHSSYLNEMAGAAALRLLVFHKLGVMGAWG